jgi:hypothetical protein
MAARRRRRRLRSSTRCSAVCRRRCRVHGAHPRPKQGRPCRDAAGFAQVGKRETHLRCCATPQTDPPTSWTGSRTASSATRCARSTRRVRARPTGTSRWKTYRASSCCAKRAAWGTPFCARSQSLTCAFATAALGCTARPSSRISGACAAISAPATRRGCRACFCAPPLLLNKLALTPAKDALLWCSPDARVRGGSDPLARGLAGTGRGQKKLGGENDLRLVNFHYASFCEQVHADNSDPSEYNVSLKKLFGQKS